MKFRFLFVTAFLIPIAATATASCVQVTPQGDSCANLKVAIDYSKCGDKSASGPQKVKCSGDKEASVAVQSGNALYNVRLNLQEGWGEKNWQVASVTSSARENAPRTVSSKKHPTHSELVAKQTAAAAIPATPQPAPEVVPTEPTAPREAASSEPTKAEGVQFSGYGDVYYAYDFNRPGQSVSGTPSIPLRYYDRNHDLFTLSLAELIVKKAASPVGFQFDVGFGDLIEMNVTNDDITKHISQAFVTVNPGFSEGLSITAGKMYTHMGLEVTHAQDNFNYSRSFTYGYALPFWHLGVKANQAFMGGKLNAMLAIYNGWAVDTFDNNTGKTFGASLNGTPTEGLTLFYNVITGPEAASDNSNVRTVHDVNFTWEAAKSLTFAGDFVLGKNSNGTTSQVWKSFELLARFRWNENLTTAGRFEYFDDMDGSQIQPGTSQAMTSGTLTQGYEWGGGFETRLEYRFDKSTQAIFSHRDGTPRNTRHSLAIAALYKF